jgi:hypothetical protein
LSGELVRADAIGNELSVTSDAYYDCIAYGCSDDEYTNLTNKRLSGLEEGLSLAGDTGLNFGVQMASFPNKVRWAMGFRPHWLKIRNPDWHLPSDGDNRKVR